MALQDGSLATNLPGTATPMALATVSVVGADTAQCQTAVTLALALTAQTVWKVGCYTKKHHIMKQKLHFLELVMCRVIYSVVILGCEKTEEVGTCVNGAHKKFTISHPQL